jgi:hypothetical protein
MVAGYEITALSGGAALRVEIGFPARGMSELSIGQIFESVNYSLSRARTLE